MFSASEISQIRNNLALRTCKFWFFYASKSCTSVYLDVFCMTVWNGLSPMNKRALLHFFLFAWVRDIFTYRDFEWLWNSACALCHSAAQMCLCPTCRALESLGHALHLDTLREPCTKSRQGVLDWLNPLFFGLPLYGIITFDSTQPGSHHSQCIKFRSGEDPDVK